MHVSSRRQTRRCVIKSADTAAPAVLLLALAAGGVSADADHGRVKAAQCAACHGPAGISTNPLFPHLAGQHAGYLQRQLEAFRNGDRYDPLMTPVAESLSPADIRGLAAHYSRIGPLANPGASADREPAGPSVPEGQE